MKITEDIIERYFNNACDEDERKAVNDYFIRHPEALRKYLTENSWQEFRHEKKMLEAVSEKMLSVIRDNTYRNRVSVISRWRWIAAAAAVLLLITAGTWYTSFNADEPAKQLATTTEVKPASTTYDQHTFNTTGKTLSFILEDGSKVRLEPNSELIYPVPFSADSRSITMKGKAVFYVAKDKARPFTVHAGQLATTAIGTVFSVTAFEGKSTRVHLLSGKVRVDADSTLMAKGLKSTVLIPGQVLQLDGMQHLVIINPKERIQKNDTPLMAKQKTPPSKNGVLVFHNEPLANIFTTLSEQYKTNISFRPEQVAGMTFTGKFDPEKETLFDFILTISSLNDLTAVNQTGAIQVLAQ